MRLLPPRFASVSFWRKAALPVAVTVVAGISTAPSVFAATAADQQKVNKQLSQLRGELSEVSGDEADLLGKLDDLNNRKADLDSQVADLQSKIDAAQKDLDSASARLADAQQRVDAAQQKLVEAQTALAVSTQLMRDQAVNAYMGSEVSTDLTSFVLHANDMREVSAASEYLSQVVRDKRQVVEEHKELEGQANDAKAAVDAIRKQAEDDRNVIAQRSQDLLSQKAQLDGVHAQLDQQAADQAALLGEIESKKVDIQAQMDSLQRQSDSIAAQLRAVAPSTGGGGGGGSSPAPSPSGGKGILANPVPGAPRTSPFGMRLDPVTGKYQLHAGQDFGVKTGTPILAAADGTVVITQPSSSSGGYGNYTCVNHGNNMATCYAHQSQFMVSSGQHVKRGQVIGLSGSTGYSTGPHLHFEVRISGNPVDPVGYL
jgi:murein DD-endopeptidase MepM/ murein hydrolase activator NlpD